jgi:hypothetical protein
MSKVGAGLRGLIMMGTDSQTAVKLVAAAADDSIIQ